MVCLSVNQSTCSCLLQRSGATLLQQTLPPRLDVFYLAAVIPEGLSQVVEGMTSGSVRLAVLPPELAYGPKSVSMPGKQELMK
jgi:hypothetical protein